MNVFVQEGVFNEMPNTLIRPNNFPAAWIIIIRTTLISSPPPELDGIDTRAGLKAALFHSTS